MNYINLTIDQIHREEKLCLIMGDFNIDLLKSNTHSTSENFLNVLGSFFFQPHILQPTRITDHSSTLIDNIFFKGHWQPKFLLHNLKVLAHLRINMLLIPCQSLLFRSYSYLNSPKF